MRLDRRWATLGLAVALGLGGGGALGFLSVPDDPLAVAPPPSYEVTEEAPPTSTRREPARPLPSPSTVVRPPRGMGMLGVTSTEPPPRTAPPTTAPAPTTTATLPQPSTTTTTVPEPTTSTEPEPPTSTEPEPTTSTEPPTSTEPVGDGDN